MEDRLSWKDLIQKKEHPLTNNLLPNVALNNKNTFDEDNSTINRLNNEILKLKRKTQFVDEKDNQIKKLETRITELKRELESKKSELKELKSQMETLQDLNLNLDTNELERENSILKREIQKLKRYSSPDIDYSGNIEESIVLNTERIKRIIESKSGYNQDDKVDFILKQYKLINGDNINKSFLSKIILEIL